MLVSETADKTNQFEYSDIANLNPQDNYDARGYTAYYSSKLSRGHIFIERSNEKLKYPLPETQFTGTLTRTKNVGGWKLHVAIEDSDDNLSKAWDIIVDKIIEHEIQLTKIIKESVRESLKQDPQQCGKEITLYAYREARPTDEWEKFINQVTESLARANIKPGPLPGSDNEIKGSNYFSYRYENKGNRGIVSVDPFVSLQIDCQVQQPQRGIAPVFPQRNELSDNEEEIYTFHGFTL
jgi:hypothetical protein